MMLKRFHGKLKRLIFGYDGLEASSIGWLIEKLYERLKTDTIYWSISDAHAPSLGLVITTDSQFCGKTQA